MKNQLGLGLAGLFALALGTGLCRASVVYDVSMNTAPLIGHPAAFGNGEFLLDFQLVDGSAPTGNVAEISDFNFGTGGSADPSVYYSTGNASGDINSAVFLTAGGGLNELAQGFVPGQTLSFTVTLPGVVATPFNDTFSFDIIDQSLTALPTVDGGSNTQFLSAAIDSFTPQLIGYPSDPTVAPAGGGDPINIAAPTIIPEPGALGLLGLGAVGLLSKRCRRQHVAL